MKEIKQKNHRSIEEKKKICQLLDSGVSKKVILKEFNMPRQTLKDLKPEREDKYKGLEDYFVNYLKSYHSSLITQIGPKEKKQIKKILEELIKEPDEFLQKLILDYQASWGNEKVLVRRRFARIMNSLEKGSQTETETESFQLESQFSHSKQIFSDQEHQQDHQEYYPIRKQIKHIVIGLYGINQVQYHLDQQEQAYKIPDIYYQDDCESQPQFGQQFQRLSMSNSINFNDVDEQYHSNQCYQALHQNGMKNIWSFKE